jgi:chorismate synthase
MSSNTFGKLFSVTSFGESHGPAYGGIIDGVPPGLLLDVGDFQKDLDRRRPGLHSYVSQRRESDQIEILSGIYQGKTLGTPIGFIVRNTDAKSKDYDDLADLFRPGHADYTYYQKYGIRDPRGGGRASARETLVRVAAGVVAKKFLAQKNIIVRAYLEQIGEIPLNFKNWDCVEQNPFFCPNDSQIAALENYITQLRQDLNSCGARICVIAENVPPGLGEPVYDGLDAQLAHALMSIPAVKAVEIGDGTAVVTERGTEHRDEMTPNGYLSNHAGGILGGISNGQPVIAHVSFKPTSSVPTPAQSVNEQNEAVVVTTKGRHDPCVGIRAVPVVEAMMAMVLMDCCLRWKGC